jgi:hypothetical protein
LVDGQQHVLQVQQLLRREAGASSWLLCWLDSLLLFLLWSAENEEGGRHSSRPKLSGQNSKHGPIAWTPATTATAPDIQCIPAL